MKTCSAAIALAAVASLGSTNAFVPTTSMTKTTTTTSLSMGWFDNFQAGGSGRGRLDEEYEKQQAILADRRKPKKERDAYFEQIEERRKEASEKQSQMWSWQTKNYAKGEDPITEWKKRRADGTISDLENQYGDPKKIGGIPLPMASFGVGGEFGLGGKFDNGGRFDLRLPYADQGYVDEDADVMGKLTNMFGGGDKKKKAAEAAAAEAAKVAAAKKKKSNGWPF